MHSGLIASTVIFAVGLALLFLGCAGLTFGIAIQMFLTASAVLLLIAAIVAWLVYAGIKAQFQQVKTGKEALIGSQGITTTELNPKGEVRVMGEFWQARTENGNIINGENVTVVGLDGMFLIVKPTNNKA